MSYILLRGYELLCVLAPFLAIFVLHRLVTQGSEKSTDARRSVFLFLFAFYIFAVLFLTGSGTVYELKRLGFELSLEQLNLVPFSREIDIVGYVQNVLLFMPLGFFLPLLWPKLERLHNALCYGAAFSLLIELSQMLNHRRTDIDDLILNSLGAVLGYAVFKLFAKWLSPGKKIAANRAKHEAALYLGAMFLGRFLLFDEFGLAKILFGF